jgi:hypothetical protein
MSQIPLLHFKVKKEFTKGKATFPAGTGIVTFIDPEHPDKFLLYTDVGYGHFYTKDEWEEIAEPISQAEFETLQSGLLTDMSSAFLNNSKTTISHLLTDDASPAQDTQLATSASSKIANFRNQALQLTKQAENLKTLIENRNAILKSHSATLQAKLQADREAMELQMAGIKKQVALLQHTLDMANLYLGASEIVIPIQEGKRADSSVPITIRQRILFMDEECAMLDSQGLDAKSIHKFDHYVKNPDLLQLILPEQKGVVVLKVCRETIQYKDVDPLTQILLNQENAKTYWLIRNGENLWRFWADYDAPKQLFPSQTTPVSQHRPGTKAYYYEMERAEGLKFQYYKAGLLIQGILDRTKVFTPFPDKIPPSLTDPSTWPGKISFLYDNEMNLGEGRPSFTTWLTTVNKSLLPGQRIVTSYLPRYHDREDKYPAVHPKFAKGYNEEKIWTVEKDERGFFFRFDRTDEIYTEYSLDSRLPKRRGSYRIDEDRQNWINIDAAPLADFEYYFRSRETRIDFKTMIPLLERCKALKEKELNEERPFKTLLLTAAINQYGENPSAPQQIETLVTWWKGKKRDYRPLIGDDSQNSEAYTAILKEYGKLQNLPTLPKLSDISGLQEKNPTLVVMEDPNTILAYTATDPRFFTYFTPTTFKKKKEGWICIHTGDPKPLPPKAKVHPAIVYQNPEHLAKLAPTTDCLSPKLWKPLLGCKLTELPIKLIFDDIPIQLVICQSKQHPHPTELFLLCLTPKGEIAARKIQLSRSGMEWKYRNNHSFPCILQKTENHPPGTELEDSYRICTILSSDPNAIQKAKRCQSRELWKKYIRTNKNEFINEAQTALSQHLQDEWKTSQYHQYLKEGGDVTLFEDHLRTLKKPNFPTKAFETILSEALHYGNLSVRRLRNLTFSEIKTIAQHIATTRKRDFFERQTWGENEETFQLPETFPWPPKNTQIS